MGFEKGNLQLNHWGRDPRLIVGVVGPGGLVGWTGHLDTPSIH